MTSVMERLSINEMTTYRWTFEEDVQQYVAARIPAIGVWRQKLSDFGEEKGVELIRDHGLRVSSLLWAGGFTGSEGRTHQESVEDAQDAIGLASQLGADCLVIYTGSRGGHTSNHARRLTVGALKELGDFADDVNVQLAVEPMHAGCCAEWTYLTGLDDTLALLEAVGSRAVKLVFDTYHLGHCQETLARVQEIAPQIGIVHLGDAKGPPSGEQNRCRLGEGMLPLKQILADLSAGGYQGWLDVELMGEEIESQDYEDLVRHSQAAVAELTQS
ncbi:MAG: sugar phosphate isomerase/epimerase [Pirellulaceae bacterium]|nr:sugar phosphate isomerase/epimerase [Pirellulaceae bacterium]